MGTTALLTFLTDFADQAVVLPLVLAVAMVLAFQRWPRGAMAWLVAIGATFSVMLVLKLSFLGCTSVFAASEMQSPSGHAAAAAVVCGGIAAIYGGGRRVVFSVALAGAVVIGLTRLVLHQHSWPEVLLGSATGLGGAMALARLAGPAPRLNLRPMVLTATFVLALFHGRHLAAEVAIRHAAFSAPWLPAWCQETASQPR
jgi:membrane-associated phospholipid phosphatase